MIYCDTSYLVRLYLDEPGAEEVRALCRREPVATSAHSRAEIPAALHRSMRKGRIEPHAFRVLLDQYQTEADVGAPHFGLKGVNIIAT